MPLAVMLYCLTNEGQNFHTGKVRSYSGLKRRGIGKEDIPDREELKEWPRDEVYM